PVCPPAVRATAIQLRTYLPLAQSQRSTASPKILTFGQSPAMEAQASQSAANSIAAQVLLNGLRMDTPSISSRETKARQTYIGFLRAVRFLAQWYRDPPRFAPS